MIEESKCCSNVMKKYFSKEHNKYFENSRKCWIYDNRYVKGNVKVKDHCHITTGRYKSSSHRNWNTNVKLNRKVPVILTT